MCLGSTQEPVLVAIEVLVHQVGLQALHGSPALVEHLTLRVGTAGTYYLDVGILGADGLHEHLQTVVVQIVPLLVAHTDILQVEGGGVAHLGTLLTPLAVHVAVGKLYEVKAVLYVGVQLVHGHMGLLGLVLELARQSYAQHGQRLGTDVLAQQEELVEAQSVRLIVVREVTVVEGVFPAVAVQGAVLHRTYAVLPLVACLQVGTLDDTAAGEAEHAWVYVFQSLSQVTAQSVLTSLVRIEGEQRDVLQADGLAARQEDAQLSLLLSAGRPQRHGIFLPVAAGHVELLLNKLLPLLHRVLLDELHAYLRLALGSLGPHGEAVLLVLLHADAEVTLVLQSCAALLMSRVREHHVVRTALEGTVILQLYIAEYAPAHVRLGKFEGAVLHKFAIQTTVGGEVDILKEQTVHRRLYGCAHSFRVDIHHVLGTHGHGCSGHQTKCQ